MKISEPEDKSEALPLTTKTEKDLNRSTRGKFVQSSHHISPRIAWCCTKQAHQTYSFTNGGKKKKKKRERERTQGGYLLPQQRRTFPKRPTQVLPHRDHWEKLKTLGKWRRTEFTATSPHISVNPISACSVTLTEIPAVVLTIFRPDPVAL